MPLSLASSHSSEYCLSFTLPRANLFKYLRGQYFKNLLYNHFIFQNFGESFKYIYENGENSMVDPVNLICGLLVSSVIPCALLLPALDYFEANLRHHNISSMNLQYFTSKAQGLFWKHNTTIIILPTKCNGIATILWNAQSVIDFLRAISHNCGTI